MKKLFLYKVKKETKDIEAEKARAREIKVSTSTVSAQFHVSLKANFLLLCTIQRPT